MQDEFEKAMAEYRQSRADLLALREKMAESSSTATAQRNVISVTVDANGQIIGVKFPVNAYKKMPPAELANVVRDTVREAQTMAREALQKLIEPMTPPGFTPGEFDIDRLLPENPEDATFLRHVNER